MEPLSTNGRTRRDQLKLFARNFFKHPKMLGSLIPSSQYLIGHLLRRIDWRRARVIVEYGPGVGTITAELLQHLRPDATLVVFETNDDFVRFLRESLPDPRLHVVHGSAADVGRVLAELGRGPADYVISGIPFSTMPDELRESILHATRSALKLDGELLVYQFSGKVETDLRRVFHRVDSAFELRNVLPARLFYCAPNGVGNRRAVLQG